MGLSICMAASVGTWGDASFGGSVGAWGVAGYGGFLDSPQAELQGVDVRHVFTTQHAFAALLADDSIVTWGKEMNTSGNSDQWNDDDYSYAHNFGADSSGSDLTNVRTVYGTTHSFAALKKDNTVVTWGNYTKIPLVFASEADLANVSAVYATAFSFAALKFDGTVVTWGDAREGGNSSGMNLTSVQTIAATSHTFYALRLDGTVVYWGRAGSGELDGKARTIYTNNWAFATLLQNGTVSVWGVRTAHSNRAC